MDTLPLDMAALFGHREMVKYLYEITAVKSFDNNHRLELLVNVISNGLYGTNPDMFLILNWFYVPSTICFVAFSYVALELVEKYDGLAIASDAEGETALHALARMSIVNTQGFWERCFSLC
ncbi:hypothetical protein Pint_12068 [Pistacia integerrima]|uniref:Uncharacterized protein n=1 Tax=Pistacia integerrima TaxID=434235 RepID=A0ACC0XHU0_9ROSI|nr:hypothetical protein Pint_12068 [Pistacia integerrima]